MAQNLSQANLKVKEVFNGGFSNYIPKWNKVFITGIPDRLDEKFTIAKIGNEVTEVADGGDAPESQVNELGENTITTKLYKAAVTAGDFSELFDNYGRVRQLISSKGYDFSYKLDELGVSFFNNATSTTTPYGININGTTYPLVGNSQAIGDTGSTQDNRIAGSLTKATATEARVAMMMQKAHNGNIAGKQARRIVVPPSQEVTAWEIFRSPKEPASANNNDNFLSTQAMEIITWELMELNSTTASFLLGDKSENGAYGLKMMIKLNPTMQHVMDTDSGCHKWIFRMAAQPGVVDYLGVVSIGV